MPDANKIDINNMKCTTQREKVCVWDPTPPIYWKWGSRWLPNANEIYTKKRNVHGQRKKFASPNTRDTNMLVFFALDNAKVLSFALGEAKLPNANGFALQWNIGFNWTCPSKRVFCQAFNTHIRASKITAAPMGAPPPLPARD